MTAEEKFREAEFFLNKIISDEINTTEIGHYFSAFLNSTSSIFDHLLEDANQKFFLGVSLDENLDARKFRQLSEYSGNIRAKRFIDWYDDIFKEIKKTESAKTFHVERNLNTHRRIQTPQLMARLRPLNYLKGDPLSDVVFVGDYKQSQKFLDYMTHKYFEDLNKKRKENGEPEYSPVKFSIYFTFANNNDVNIRDSCVQFFDVIRNLVINPSRSKLNA
jgi:hypothetical protein